MTISCHHPNVLFIRGVKICGDCSKVFAFLRVEDVEIVKNLVDKARIAVKNDPCKQELTSFTPLPHRQTPSTGE
jgi:hypothetical protein